MAEGGQWVIDQKPLIEHKDSVEDLCWSPTEEAMLASCSADHSIKLWDTRSREYFENTMKFVFKTSFSLSRREIFQSQKSVSILLTNFFRNNEFHNEINYDLDCSDLHHQMPAFAL